ncbi:short chain dehydrogenase [uncultured Friedmanniella sp.]|uniref:short chain dehydrogenase n=1 Tax=uncultured Friedmanniella sp. TaxID=335381 RepID=UPI0035CBF984
MRVLVIGASGLVGGAAADALAEDGCEVLRASRSAELSVDITDPGSIQALYEQVGTLDAVVCAVGSVPFKPLGELSRDDFMAAYVGKVQAQLDVVQLGTPHLGDGGSFTLTTGILAREPIAAGAAASLANGAVDSFVLAAATELPRGLRINAVSPTVLAEATGYHSSFPGFAQVSAAAVGQCFVKAVRGVQTGRVFVLDA